MTVTNGLRHLSAVIVLAVLSCADALAADHKVWMQGSGNQVMQFEPEFLKIAVGDTVTFMPEAAGHNVEFDFRP